MEFSSDSLLLSKACNTKMSITATAPITTVVKGDADGRAQAGVVNVRAPFAGFRADILYWADAPYTHECAKLWQVKDLEGDQ
jgi:hypothetical protein